jgi:TetR/AcrR family transcriptional regulator, copper-responsive repressor
VLCARVFSSASIYAAFGDKRALYLRAITEYAAASRAWLAGTLSGTWSLRGALRAVYRDARDYYLTGDGGPRGCFLLGTAVTEAHGDPQVRAIVESTLTAFTEAFEQRFVRAARDGELGATTPKALAHIATAVLNTLALRARTGADPAALDALIDATIDVICGRPVRPSGSPT